MLADNKQVLCVFLTHREQRPKLVSQGPVCSKADLNTPISPSHIILSALFLTQGPAK